MGGLTRRAAILGALAAPLLAGTGGRAVALEQQQEAFAQFLALAFFRSPNYVAGVSGWTINQDGSAEFNNLTIRGTFAGTDFIINSSGAFFYSGTPAAGNLIASIASASGTDGFGNSYQQGISSYDNTFGGVTQINGATITEFAGVNLISESTPKGYFLYSPHGGAGNLICSLASTSGTDQYGNAYPEGLGLIEGGSFLSFFNLASAFNVNPLIRGIGSGGGSGAGITALSGLSDGSDTAASITAYSKEYVSTNLGTFPAGEAVALTGNVVLNDASQSFLYGSVTGTPEIAWHNLPAPVAGWTATGFARYKLMADGTVIVRVQNLTPPAVAPVDGTTIWAAGSLPAAYVPLNTTRIPCYANALVAANGTPALEFHTDGSIQVFGIRTANPTRLDGTFVLTTI